MNVHAILGPGGAIARRLPGYEARPQQLTMAEAVADAIAARSHLIVEAGTGVGKSFAYLVPAILDAVASRKKVVVSTHTINLQEQLLLKDIPFLQGVLPPPFDAVLVKGRGNYLSLRRLRSAMEKGRSLFDLEEEVRQLERVGAWAGTTADGSRSDLDFQPLPVVWEEVRSDRDNCQGKTCPTSRECFYHAARRRMEAARVLIVNHAVYLTDLALRREGTNFLPDHDVAIFDEAHTLEGVASDHLGETIASGQVADLLARVAKLPVPPDVRDLVEPTWGHALEFFDAVLEVRGREREGTCRYRAPTGWTDRLAEALRRLGSKLLERSASEKDADAKLDIEARGKRAVALAGTLATWLGQEKPGCVYWSEARPGKGKVPKVSLTYAPIHVGPALRAELFAKVPTCILTSATLAVGQPPRFDHFARRIGLADARTLAVGSPFDYRTQVALHLPRGLPDPSGPDRRRGEDYERQAIGAIPHYLEKSRGRAFVLFTSHKMLEHAARALAPWIADRGWALLAQGDGMPHAKRVRTFKEGNCILFGVDSYWQGVDVPGEALSNVIITRLPFRVPDHPLHEARLEDIAARGGNSFVEYTVLEAVLKLKQGFGRLIRTLADRGIVVILDPRLTTKFYGKTFLDSLPACPRVVEDLRPAPSVAIAEEAGRPAPPAARRRCVQ